jgi:SAM-dependent methyltransferase
MHSVESLYLDGRHYDRMYGLDDTDEAVFQNPPRQAGGRATQPRAGDPSDTAFYLDLAKQISGPILELACGTGRYLIPWSKAGHRVVGIDRAPAMLAHAAEKAREAGVQIDLHETDMREFRLGRRFALIVIAGNSLCHLQTAHDLERFLACVRDHLAPQGRLVIDVFVPDPRLLARDPEIRYPFAVYHDPDDGVRTTVTHAAYYDPSAQINHITIYTRRDGEQRERIGTLALRMWFPAELEAMLGYNGFAIAERFGGHNRSPFDARSGKQILICKLAHVP